MKSSPIKAEAESRPGGHRRGTTRSNRRSITISFASNSNTPGKSSSLLLANLITVLLWQA